jgi:hypothetical protein
MKTKNQVIFVAIMFLVVIVFTVFFVKPFVNYEGAENGTMGNMSIYGTVHALNYDTIPTVINGITAVTSIIIGFSGAIIGLVYREDFKKGKLVRVFLLFLAFYSVIPLGLLIGVYSALISGALEYALKLALVAIYVALFDFIFTMLVVFHFYTPSLEKDTENPVIGNDI